MTSGGDAYCWGRNDFGQLGSGVSGDVSAPAAVAGLTGATAISAGFSHTCALVTGGAIKCWGANYSGQLGDGTATNRLTPVAVSGLSGATAVSSGGSHTCALMSNGTVKCWGANGGMTDSLIPVTISGLAGVQSVSAGGDHSCAVLANGTVKCWGYNGAGQLGNGTTTDSSSPVAVSGLSGVLAVSAGGSDTCALLSNGTVKCWGYNGDGELGNGTKTDSLTPVSVTGLSGVDGLSAGDSYGYGAEWDHTCATLGTGAVKCWGYGLDGELGNGAKSSSSVPVTVSSISNPTQISAGASHSCALLVSGGARCWGQNSSGELGSGNRNDGPAPVAVKGLTGATEIAAGGYHTCALLSGGTVKCWGDNEEGQLGTGVAMFSPLPVKVIGLAPVVRSTYHPITPVRLLDTRATPTNGHSGKLSAGVPITFLITGRGGVPAGASAVTGNLTVTGSSVGYAIYLGPAPVVSPSSSTINFVAGQTLANGLTVALSASGTLSATYMGPAGATTDLVIDVTGFYTPDTSGETYHPITPARDVDTRIAKGLATKLVANTPACFTVAGLNGVSSAAKAVSGNITVANPTSAWALYIGPVSTTAPSTSTLNFTAGQVASNNVTVSLNTSGKLCATYIGPAGATTDLVFDVTGFYTADTSGASFVPISPVRLLDTRVGNGLAGKFTAGTPRTFTIATRGGIPSGASGVTGNLTVVDETASWAIYLGPTALSAPTTSSLNFNVGEVKANGVTVALSSSGSLSATYLGPAGATTNLVFDVTGYFVK